MKHQLLEKHQQQPPPNKPKRILTMTETTTPQDGARFNVSNRELVYNAVVDVFNVTGKPVNCEKVAELLDMKPSKVYEAMNFLANDERFVRAGRGLYEPAAKFRDDQAVSTTVQKSGMVKMEVGDQLIELTPGEAAKAGASLMGFAMRLMMSIPNKM